jgi:hypothetical protein
VVLDEHPDAPILVAVSRFAKEHGCDAIVALWEAPPWTPPKRLQYPFPTPKPLRQLAGYLALRAPVKMSRAHNRR